MTNDIEMRGLFFTCKRLTVSTVIELTEAHTHLIHFDSVEIFYDIDGCSSPKPCTPTWRAHTHDGNEYGELHHHHSINSSCCIRVNNPKDIFEEQP